MNYKISIIIPTFNIEDDIKRAINSLINQTIGFKNLEIIIVDDCSTDNTKQIILEYSEQYDNIKYIFLDTNSGSAGKPRNICIKHATANYIMFLDNDDEYVPEACEIFYNEIEKNDVNLIVCSKTNSLYTLNDYPQEIDEPAILEEINVLENPDVLYYPTTNYAGAMWCKIFKREFLLKNNIQCLEKLPEDVYFMHKCFYLNPNVLFITNLALYNHYFYRVSGTSITVTLGYNFLNKLFTIYDKLKTLSQNYSNSKKFFNRYSQLFFNLLIYNIITTDANKQQKISLMKTYSNYSKQFDFKPEGQIYTVWYKLNKTQRFELCYIYSQIIKAIIKLKSKLTD